MNLYFPTRIYSFSACRQCPHGEHEHIQDSRSSGCYYGSCSAKSCSCGEYKSSIIFISEKTRGSQTMNYLFYQSGLNVIPVNTKKRSFDPLLNPWKELSLPDLAFEKWKKMGLFKKGNNRLNYGIIIGKVHRGIDRGLIIRNMVVDFDIDKGTTFTRVFEFPDNEYEMFSAIYGEHTNDKPRASQVGNPSSTI